VRAAAALAPLALASASAAGVDGPPPSPARAALSIAGESKGHLSYLISLPPLPRFYSLVLAGWLFRALAAFFGVRGGEEG
jgi:hypothetical protein